MRHCDSCVGRSASARRADKWGVGGISFFKAGHPSSFGMSEGFPAGSVRQFAWDRDDSLWAAALGDSYGSACRELNETCIRSRARKDS